MQEAKRRINNQFLISGFSIRLQHLLENLTDTGLKALTVFYF